MTDHEKLRILVIDDEITQRMLVKDFLEEAGHVVRQAEDGRRGLKMAEVTKPDVILLDVLLPVIDGYSVCRIFKEAPATCDTPVILITASRETDVIERGLAAGADDFVTKPVDWAFLSDRVVNVVRKARERAEMARQIRQKPSAPHHDLPAPEATAYMEAQLDEFVRSAELQVAQANEAAARERQRLEAEYLEALNCAVADACAGKDAEIASIRSEHDAELREFRERYELEIETIRGSARHEVMVAERRHALELETVRAALNSATSHAESRATSIRDDTGNNHAARVHAAWGLTLRWATAQSNLATAIAADAKAATGGASATEMQAIERSARAIANATSKMKIVAQAMAAPAERPQSAVAIGSLLAEIAKQADGVARARRVSVTCQISDAEAAVHADLDKLRYSLLSLVSNAIRFTPAGGTVALKLFRDGSGDVRIDVVDAGVGVPPAKLQSLRACLDEPTRHDDAEEAAAAGFGILAAMALTRQMGGVLELESQLGAGTRASLIFPDIEGRRSERMRQMKFAG